MKILVISHLFPSPLNDISGIFVHEQIKALMSRDVDVRVISPVPLAPFPINRMDCKWRDYSRIPQNCVVDGVQTYYPRYVSFPRAWFLATSGHRMYRGIRGPAKWMHSEFPFDLIHAHVALPDGYAGLLLARELGKPLVVTIHGEDVYINARKDGGCRAAVKQVVRTADRVIFVSNRIKQVLESELCSTFENAISIHNGVSATKVYGGSAARTDTAKIIIIITVGYLIERKGHRYVLESMKQLVQKHPQLRYLIVGSGPMRSNLEALAEKMGLKKYVNFLGNVPSEELPRLLGLSDIFVLPSWNEAFGIAYLEAMANGKPVIGCYGEGVEEFVTHGKTGLLVPPRDVGSLVQALDTLLSHREEAKAMGERARMVVQENFTWKRNAEKTLEVYRDVLNDH